MTMDVVYVVTIMGLSYLVACRWRLQSFYLRHILVMCAITADQSAKHKNRVYAIILCVGFCVLIFLCL